jgi:hypothetical protein
MMDATPAWFVWAFVGLVGVAISIAAKAITR